MTSQRPSSYAVGGAILALILAALACNAPATGPTATPPLPATAIPPPPPVTAAVTAAATAPNPPTELVTPTGAPPTPVNATTSVETNIRAGPGTNYAILATMAAGLGVRLVGRNADKSWWQIEFPSSPDGRAWVFAANVAIAPGANVDALPVASAPPAPPTYTATSLAAVSATPKPPTATSQKPPATATTAPSPSAILRADKIRLVPGECTTLRWDIDNIKGVFLNAGRGEEPVTGHDTRVVCPDVTTIYVLHVIQTDGSSQKHSLTVMVSGPCGNTPIISRFEASDIEIHAGDSVLFIWDVACAQAVFFKAGSGDREPVGGHDRREVTPSKTTVYKLIVVGQDGSEIKREITVTVL